jgi:acetolactate synthase-1/2/3 large subunit
MMAKAKKNKHKMAGQNMTGAETIIQVMKDEGVNTVFGYNGGAILPTYDAVFRWNDKNSKDPLNLIVPANEQGAVFMASGYARATGEVGVAMVTSGPGATNCATPIRDALADSVPIVLISGQVARAAIGTDAFQEAPVLNLMSACSKHTFLVEEVEALEDTIRTAFHIARSGRPGPVVIDVPKDVQNWVGSYDGEGILPLRGYQQRLEATQKARLTPEDAKTFYKLLKAAKRPLLYVGGGVINSNASKQVRSFAKKFKLPSVSTLMGLGAMDATDDLSLNMLGMHGTAYANYAVMDCDFLIAVGARFDDRVAGVPKEFAKNAKIAHIDIDAAEIGKVKSVDWHHVGDATTTLKDLSAFGKNVKVSHEPWIKKVMSMKKKHKMDYNHQADIIQPQMAVAILNELTRGEAIITTGVGQHQMFAAQYIDHKHPRHWLTSGSMGTMGYGLPAAIGAQVAHPGKIVVDIDGDGSIRMNYGEMETCTNYDIPVKVLLLNNDGDGMVVQWQSLYFDGRLSGTDKTLHKKDFVMAAQADGFKFAKCVSKKSALRKALKEFVEFDGPAFLEVKTDKNAFVYPMVGPGISYADMITGPHIKSRTENGNLETLEASDSY